MIFTGILCFIQPVFLVCLFVLREFSLFQFDLMNYLWKWCSLPFLCRWYTTYFLDFLTLVGNFCRLGPYFFFDSHIKEKSKRQTFFFFHLGSGFRNISFLQPTFSHFSLESTIGMQTQKNKTITTKTFKGLKTYNGLCQQIKLYLHSQFLIKTHCLYTWGITDILSAFLSSWNVCKAVIFVDIFERVWLHPFLLASGLLLCPLLANHYVSVDIIATNYQSVA